MTAQADRAKTYAALRRAQELVTARQMLSDGLVTDDEFLLVVTRVLIEVGVDGLVPLLAAQAGFTSLVVETLAGPEMRDELMSQVALMLTLSEAGAP